MIDETANSANRALLIAYQYPPCQQSSGYLRTLAFSRYLPAFGWNPVVLTASERAYGRSDATERDRIPDSVPVVRAFARDARDLFSIRRKYPSFVAVPDRQSSWWLGAMPTGLKLIRRYKPSVLWATQPTPTAFWIAYSLHRITGIPWVADFRDPIGLGISRQADRMRRWIERKTVYSSSRIVFTTLGAASAYATAYPDVPEDRWNVIPNGYDETDFSDINDTPEPMESRPLRLVHSGVLYRDGRNPSALLGALRQLKAEGELTTSDVEIVLRASGSEEYFQQLVNNAGVGDIVHLRPPLPYREALREICSADGLLVLQGAKFNSQIPAKIYEYYRARRPVMALTDPAGNTAQALYQADIDTIAPIDDPDLIAHTLRDFVTGIRAGTAPTASETDITRYSRQNGARELSRLFNDISHSKDSNA